MNKVHRARARPLAVAALVAIGALASTGSASAQSVLFQGYTAGCFGVACAPITTTSTLGGLVYTPDPAFSVTTVGGFAAIGGIPDTFGSFSLSGTPFTYTGNTFKLLITFTDPTSNQNTFMAALTGTVTSAGNGGANFDFDNTTQFWYAGPNTYSVRVNDLSITPGNTLTVSGVVTATDVVPEPISMVLLGSGLLGLGAVRRRRTKVDKADLI